MINLKVGWLLTFFTLFLAFSAISQNLKVMTYNIRLDVASDEENAWPQRRDFLAAQIQFHGPDIFGTQEGLPHQIEFLQKFFPEYNSTGIGREAGGKGESTHIFFQKSKFLLKQSHTFWLSPTPDSVSMGWDAACLRVCTAVLLKNKQTNRQFWIFNTHLDHIGETARRNSIDLILKKIETLNTGKFPVIFMGNLNAEPDSELIARLEKEMRNTRKVSETPAFGPSGTFNGFIFEKPVSRLIDYIFISKSSGVTVKKYGVLSDSKNLRYPSDHLPVLVELELR